MNCLKRATRAPSCPVSSAGSQLSALCRRRRRRHGLAASTPSALSATSPPPARRNRRTGGTNTPAQPAPVEAPGGRRTGGCKRAAAAGVGAAAYTFFCCRKETVPYTNCTRYIILSPNAERRLGEFLFELEKSKLRSNILPPDDPATVRVRHIAMKIIRAVNHGLAVDAIEATRGYGDGIPTDGTIKNRDVEDGSPSDNAASAAAQQGGAQQDNLEGLKWEVIVVKDKMINAMCVPGSKIIVYTGLLDRFKEDVEVATVLGHEVGHVIARHTAEQLTKNLWVLVLEIIILQFMSIPDNALDVMTKYFFRLLISRSMGMEADHVGLMLLAAAAAYDPRVAPSVYEKLGKIGGGSSAMDDYTSTHPSCKTRSQVLSQDHVMNKALELYFEASSSQHTEGTPLDSGAQQVIDDERQSINKTICAT